jgi:CDP-diacylglycerol--serine O-phosphatidyltransferase
VISKVASERHLNQAKNNGMTDRNETDAGAPTPPRKRSKGIYILPNMITLAALFGGFYAIVMAMNGRFDLATLGIFRCHDP